MIEIKNKIHKLCLIDTCIISEILKNKSTLGKRVVSKFIDENYVFCYTIQTIGELKRAKDLYDEFFKYLFPMLSFLLKNYNQLTEDEIKAYPSLNTQNPFLFFFNPLSNENFNDKIKEYLDNPKSQAFFENEQKEAQETLKAIVEAARNWKPKGKSYTKKEIEEWVELSVWHHIMDTERDFFNKQYNVLKHVIDYKKFLAWRIISYVKFYKFYLNPMRKPKVNDLNDILNTSSLPYIDAVLCENDISEILRQLQMKHDFIKHLEIMKLKDFR